MDCREREALHGAWYDHFDERKMIVVVNVLDYEVEDELKGYVEVELQLPVKFVVCSLCDGTGKHVNPSIDSQGISGEEFAEDPDFAESYFGGMYDVSCYRCGGRRVEPEVDEERAKPEDLARFNQAMSARADDQRERESELRWAL